MWSFSGFHKGVGLLLVADRCFGAMAGIYHGLIRQRVELLTDRGLQHIHVAPVQVCTADSFPEQGIAG